MSGSTGDTSQLDAATGHHPKKLLTHNHLLKKGQGLEAAFPLAKAMGADYLRYDFDWRKLDTDRPGRWLWDVADGAPNHWADSLDPALACTKAAGMSTLAVTKCSACPGHRFRELRDSYDSRWGQYEDTTTWPGLRRRVTNEKEAALWAAWREKQGEISNGPFKFLELLLDELAEGIEAGTYDIVGFNVENEPNVNNMPHQDNFVAIDVPVGTRQGSVLRHMWDPRRWRRAEGALIDARETVFETYTTADFIMDMLSMVKRRCSGDPRLMDAVTVINLHSYDRHWDSWTWRAVGLGNPDLDVLGIDIYRTHFWTGTLGDKKRMRRLSAEYGKPWWVVEMEGAPAPTRWPGRKGHSGVPTVDKCRKWAKECERYGASVVGFYRLWGVYEAKVTAFDTAYNIYQDPGNDAKETVVDGKSYAAMIRDLFEDGP